MFRSRFLLSVAIAVVAALSAPAVSRADFTTTLTLTDGTNSLNLDLAYTQVGNSLTVTPTVVGSASYGGSLPPTSSGLFPNATELDLTGLHVGVFTINLTAVTTNSPGTSVVGGLGLSTITISRTDTTSKTFKTLTISESAAFSNPQPLDGYLLGSNFGGSFGNTINGQSATLTSAFGEGTVLFTQDTTRDYNVQTSDSQQTTGGTVSGSWLSLPGGVSPFVLTNTVDVTMRGDGTFTSGGVTTQVVPAPAPHGLIMFASALPFFGLLRRRLRKSEMAAVA